MEVVLDVNLHSALRGVHWMFQSSELFKVLETCWLKHWIVTLHKLKVGRTLAAYRLLIFFFFFKKSSVSYLINKARIMHYHVSSDHLCFFTPAMRPSCYSTYRRWNAQRYDRKVADSDPQKRLDYCSVRWARQQSDSGVWQKSLLQRWTRHRYLNQFPPRQQKMLTSSVLVRHSGCSANYCSLHPSENRIKLLGKSYYAIASWNTLEATVYVSMSAFYPPWSSLSALWPMLTLVLMPVCCRSTAPAWWT